MITLTITPAVLVDLPLWTPYTRTLRSEHTARKAAYQASQRELASAIRAAFGDAGMWHFETRSRMPSIPPGPWTLWVHIRTGGLKTRRGAMPKLDGDNLLKAVPDALQSVGFLDDDSLERFRAGGFWATIEPALSPGVHRATVYIARGVEVRHD